MGAAGSFSAAGMEERLSQGLEGAPALPCLPTLRVIWRLSDASSLFRTLLPVVLLPLVPAAEDERGILGNGSGGSANWWTFAPISLLLKATRGRDRKEVIKKFPEMHAPFLNPSLLIQMLCHQLLRRAYAFLGRRGRAPADCYDTARPRSICPACSKEEMAFHKKRFKVTPYSWMYYGE